MIVPLKVKEATIIVVWSICTDGGTRIVDGETFAGWCVISR